MRALAEAAACNPDALGWPDAIALSALFLAVAVVLVAAIRS